MAEHPHCNTTVLHAPGECYFCDHYPARQQARIAEGGEFTPNEANGWSGNIAVRLGEMHTHMGVEFIVGGGTDPISDRIEVGHCAVNFKRGWYCTRGVHGPSPCALLPKWWNVSARWRYRR